MKPRTPGPSRCASATSTVGENFSGLLACAAIIVTSARTSRLNSWRVSSSCSVPSVALRSIEPMRSMNAWCG